MRGDTEETTKAKLRGNKESIASQRMISRRQRGSEGKENKRG